MNVHEESVLNKLTEKGPAWTIMALAILRLKDASTMTRLLVGAGGLGALLKLVGVV